jgi:hypothetical protein
MADKRRNHPHQMTLGEMLASGKVTLPPSPEPSEDSKAYYRFLPVIVMVNHNPEAVAEAATRPPFDELGWKQFDVWYQRFRARYRERLEQPLRAVED